MNESMKIVAVALLALAGPLAAQGVDHERRWQEAARREEKDGDTKAALAAFEALAADATAPEALRARALLRAGACLERLGDLDAARARYQRLDEQHPGARAERAAASDALDRLLVRLAARRQGLDTIQLATDGQGVARVTLELRDANVREVLVAVAAAARRSLVLGPSVVGTVTLSLRGIEVEAALRTIVETVGEYALVRDPTGLVLRVGAVQDLEEQVELRTYRLRARPVGRETAGAWQGAVAALQELLRSSRVRGVDARLDPASRTLFVRCAPHQAPAVEAALADVREPGPAPAPAGPRVGCRFEDANLRAVLAHVAAEAKRPLLVAGDVRGQVSVHAEQVPWRTLVGELLLAAGSFALVSTGAGDLALSRHQADAWRGVEAWPLARGPAELWAAGGWTLPGDGRGGPRLFVQDALDELGRTLPTKGALVAVDPTAHRLVACLPRHELDAFRAALEAAGHVAARPEAAATELLRLEPGTSVRTAIQRAARGANVVVAPDVTGEVEGTLRGDAPAAAALAAIAAAAGPFEVVSGQEVLRIASREQVEQRLETRRLPLTVRPAASAAPLARLVDELARGSQVKGALALHQPDGNFVLASLPAPLLAQLEAVVAACDSTAGLAGPEPVLACTFDPTASAPLGTEQGGLLQLGPAGFQSATVPTGDEPLDARIQARVRRLLAAGVLRPGVTTAVSVRADLGRSFFRSSSTSDEWHVTFARVGATPQLDLVFAIERDLLLRAEEVDDRGTWTKLPVPERPAPAALEGLLWVRVEGDAVVVTRHGAAPAERRFTAWPRRR